MTEIHSTMPSVHAARARAWFGFATSREVLAFCQGGGHVPEVDPSYRFNEDATLAILAGFARNRRVMLQGLHGTGKSTHIEQVAARLNWPCVRVNLDGHVKIGRASWRERVCQYGSISVGAVTLKKKTQRITRRT